MGDPELDFWRAIDLVSTENDNLKADLSAARARVAVLEGALRETVKAWTREASWGDGIAEEHASALDRARAALAGADGKGET